jgi:hypothetical protein
MKEFGTANNPIHLPDPIFFSAFFWRRFHIAVDNLSLSDGFIALLHPPWLNEYT